ncbi:hypothetical protein MTO96_013901 [Rhipicephalus appendiculatus]
MDYPMEDLIKAVMMGHRDKTKGPSSALCEVLEELMTVAPHLVTSDTYLKLRRAELDAAEAQERYEAACEMNSVWKDIRLSCHKKDGLKLIKSRYHEQAEEVQAAIVLSEDPVGRHLGLEDCDLDEKFIDHLHRAVFKHLQDRDSRIKQKLQAHNIYFDVGVAAEALLANINRINKSIANMRLGKQDRLFKLEKKLQEIAKKRLELPELGEKHHAFLLDFENNIIQFFIEIAEKLEEELECTFTAKDGIGKAMEVLIRKIQSELLHKVSEEEKKLQEKEELLDKFDDLCLCPEFDLWITEYKYLCLLEEAVNKKTSDAEPEESVNEKTLVAEPEESVNEKTLVAEPE